MTRDLKAALEDAVPEPTVYLDPDSMLKRARRRRGLNTSLAALLTVFAVVGVGMVFAQARDADDAQYANPVTGSNGEPQTRRDLVQDWERAAGHPIALPTEVPVGYQLVFEPGKFAPPEGRSWIDVCAIPLDTDPVGICVGTNDVDRPRFSTTTDDGQWQVVVRTLSAPHDAQDLKPWEELRYTTDLESIEWLAEPVMEEQAWRGWAPVLVGLLAALVLALTALRLFRPEG
jgi:hypothetical protein